MEDSYQTILASLKSRFQFEVQEFRGDISLVIVPEQVVDICRALRDEFGFEMLVEETAVDYWPQETPRFHVVYGFRSLQKNLLVMLRLPLNGNAPSLPTIESVYPNANWFERELWDMFGIRFDGHSDLRRIFNAPRLGRTPAAQRFPAGI